MYIFQIWHVCVILLAQQLLFLMYIKKIYNSADIPEFPYFTAAILDLDRLPVMRKLAHFFECLLGVHLQYSTIKPLYAICVTPHQHLWWTI